MVEERGIDLDEIVAHGAGWQVHVEDLAAHLAGEDRAEWRARWAQLMPTYSEQGVRARSE